MHAEEKTHDPQAAKAPEKKVEAGHPGDKKAVACATVDLEGHLLTTDQGVRIENTDDSLKAGLRGPSLIEDFHLREKITHFDHERIPERVVHARGAGAHGYFEAYKSMTQYTRAHFLSKPGLKTPVFVRFSTVAGSRGSADTVRDVRGFAVKFYTEEGNFDLVGNNIPIFFIQDGIKFPDIVHAVKPEPHHEMPQASTAHDTFWDFMSLTPETTHMAMWILSDRAIPQSFRTMEGFGVHTFRFINSDGGSRFVKFHWKPILGLHSLVWDEAQKIAGQDPDFHRRDLWEAIETGNFPEYELGVQIIEENEAEKLGFDLFDATKIVPEEIVPVMRIGKLTLNRNPDNFFAETEQVAFHVANVVPGIDVTNDPLMQARLFSYLDTQLTRLGGPNFAQIPINQPIVPVHNNQQDGFMRHSFNKGRANYLPNSTGGGCPFMASLNQGAYRHYPERLQGTKIRERSSTFSDHFSQGTLFWNSLSPPEKQHLLEATCFELSNVIPEIRERMLGNLARSSRELAEKAASYLGVKVPEHGDSGKIQRSVQSSPALSMANTAKSSIRGRKIAILVEDGFTANELDKVKERVEGAKAQAKIISSRLGTVKSADGHEVKVDGTFLNSASVLFSAVFVPGGENSVKQLAANHKATCFLSEAYRHYKPICLGSGAKVLLQSMSIPPEAQSQPSKMSGMVLIDGNDLQSSVKAFVEAVAQHRFWERTPTEFK